MKTLALDRRRFPPVIFSVIRFPFRKVKPDQVHQQISYGGRTMSLLVINHETARSKLFEKRLSTVAPAAVGEGLVLMEDFVYGGFWLNNGAKSERRANCVPANYTKNALP